MKKPKASDGYGQVFFSMLILNGGFGLLALLFLVLHFTSGMSLGWTFGSLALWVLLTLLRSALVVWGNQAGREETRQNPNRNPYSAKNDDVFPKT